ncbi:MAG: exodeoxyribonuclease VII large subunit, partial [Clostridia bacterium]|nr:exodeoxyribonuclease VII large subunit [Clostridia bacterium]
AELAVPDRAELLSALYALPRRLSRVIARENERRRERLDALKGRQIFTRPETVTRDRMRDVDALSDRAGAAVRAAYSSKREGFSALAATLTALNPLATLSRGYAIAETPDGKPVVSVLDRAAGDPVDVVLSDGTLSTVVRAVTPRKQIGTGDRK